MSTIIRNDLMNLEDALGNARERYLRATGWSYRCDTPGAFWLWQKQLPDGRIMAVNITTAIAMQDSWPK